MTEYVVTGHLAAFDTMTTDGKVRQTFFRGQRVPSSATAAAIAHHLSVNLIAPVPGSEPVGVDSAGAAVFGEERAGEVEGDPGAPFLMANTVSDEQAHARGLTLETAHVEPVRTTDLSTDVERQAAQEKLAALGGEAPDGRASKAVHVEYLVSKGYGRAEMSKLEKPELVTMSKQASQS